MDYKRYRITAKEPFEINGEKYTGVDLLYRKRIRPKWDTPKSYKRLGGFTDKHRGTFESGSVTVYKARTKTGFAASMYRDGCFNEYFAPCILIK